MEVIIRSPMSDQLEDTLNPAQPETSNPISKPEAMSLTEIQNKAIKWNAEWKTVYDVKKNQWEQNYKLFRQFDHGLMENVSTRVYEVWSNIQTEIPHITNSIFTKSEIVKPIPKFLDVNKNTLKIQEYVNRMILVANQGRKDATDAIQDFLVFGTVIAKTFWDNELKAAFDIRPSLTDANGNVVPNPTSQQWVPRYEGKPAFYNIDIFDFALDPNYRGHDLDKAAWCRERIYFTKEQLKKKMQSGEIVQLSDNELTPGGQKIETGREIRDRIDGMNTTKYNEKAYVDEFWTELFWEENGVQKSGKYFFWLLNNDKIIKMQENVFNRNPYMSARCYRLSHEFYGLGDVDVMSALSEHLNVIHTQGALLAKQTGEKLTLYTSAAGVDSQQIKRRDQGLLKVKDLNAIKTENTTAGADLGVLINYKSSVKSDLSNAVGINDLLRGEDPGDVTATQITVLNSNSSARLALKLQNFQDEYIVPLASNFYNLSKQFIDTYSLIMDNQLIQLSQQDFIGDYDWVPQGTIAQANRNLRINQLSTLAAQLGQAVEMSQKSNGAVKMPNFNMGQFMMNEVLPMYEIQNPEQYFEEPMPVPPPQPSSMGPVGQTMPLPPTTPISESSLPTETTQSAGLEGNASSIMS